MSVAAAVPAPAAVEAAARREARVDRAAGRVAVATGFALTALIYVPVLWLGILSVSADPLAGRPFPLTLRWYLGLADNSGWVEPLVRSLEIAAITSLLSMAGATIVGRCLPRLGWGAGLLLLLFVLPLAVPGIVTSTAIFTFYRLLLGIRMGFWSLVLAHFTWAFPFALLGMLVVTSRFDRRLLEAAADLGAGAWRRFWDIERPLLAPGVATAGLFGFLLSLTELPRSIFVAGPIQTLPLYTWAAASARASEVSLVYCLNTLISIASTAGCVLAVRLLARRVRA